ncbi:MAG: hypothetical protein H8E57_04660 [Candidatus Cloacimonetes bacterium]|nr:hypothetical protein [Candidatus Cloacimonadota bacterium]
MLNKIFFFIIFCLTSFVIEAEEKYNFDFLKDMDSEAADSSEVKTTQTANNENEVTAEISNKKETIPEFWQYYIVNESYLENMNNSWNLARLFNRKNYDENDFTYLTQKCRFIQHDNAFTSLDEKVRIVFKDNYVKNILFINLTTDDLLLLDMNESITYDELEEMFGYQYSEVLKLWYSMIAYFEPDTTMSNQFRYQFNFSSEIGFTHIEIAPLLPDKIQLDESAEIRFMLYGCYEGDCENGYGILRWSNEYFYKGTFSNNWPQNGIVYRFNYIYKTYAKEAEFQNGEIVSGYAPTIFDPKTYMKPLLIKLHEAVDDQRKIKSTREDVDSYHHRMQQNTEWFESDKQNMITYSERGIEYAKECKRLTKQAYNILVDTDNGNCLDALMKLAQISETLQEIEDVFWVLRHIAILNGEMDQAQINVITRFGYLFENVEFGEVNRLLENCGYFEE